MSSTGDEREDYDDLPPDPRPRRTSNPALIIILVLAGLVLLPLVVCGGAMVLFWARPAAPPAPAAAVTVNKGPDAGAMRRVYARDELKAEILAATRDVVRNRLGAPQSVAAGPPEVWHYAGVTRAPDTGRIDRDVAIVFENGVVVELRFTPPADVKGP